MDNRFYKITNSRDRQYTFIYINLDDISSVQYPNESLNVGIITTKTGKEIYVQKDELDKIITLLNTVNIDLAKFYGEPVNKLSGAKLFNAVREQSG